MPVEEKSQEPTVTSVSQWRKGQAEGQLVTLPSGNVVRAKRSMDLVHLLRAGKIPNPLAGIVQQMVDGKKTQMPSTEEVGMEGIAQMLKLIDMTVVRNVTEPRVEPPPEPEENETDEEYALRIARWEPEDPNAIPLTWIDIDDRMFIFAFAQGMAADLTFFREQQAAAMAPAPTQQDVPKKAKRASKSK